MLPSEYTVAEINRALDVGHTVDQTTFRVVGGPEVADFRVQTKLRLAKLGQAAPHPDWTVRTGAPVRATPAAYGAVFGTATATDLVAFASDTDQSGSSGGITTGDVSNGCTGTCATSNEFILSNIYATTPHVAAWGAKTVAADHFELSSLMFGFNPAQIQVYSLASTTKSLVFCVELPSAPDGGAGYTNTTASLGTACTGWASTSGITVGTHAVTWSSPYPAYDSAGNITAFYYGDDAGRLQCVNLQTSAPSVCAGGAYGTAFNTATTGALIGAATSKLGPPAVIRISNSPVENVIFVGDDSGNFYQIDDNAGVLTTRSSSLGTGAAFAVHGAPVLDFTNQNAYVAAGGKIFQFPLSTSATWAPTASVTLFSGATAPIDSSPSLDDTSDGGDYIYVATNNSLYKTAYPLGSTTYSEGLLNAVSSNYTLDSQLIAAASEPLGYPFPWAGSVYVGTGTSSSATGKIEEYGGCSASASKPILSATSNVATYGDLIQSGMIIDNAATDLYFGFDNGSTGGGGLVSYPLPSKTASAWSCPSGTTSTPGGACGTTASCVPSSGCLSDTDCAGTPATPACDTSTHTCVLCTGTDPGACTGSTPACNTAGSSPVCVQCTASETTACTGSTPYCQTVNADSHQFTCVGCLASTNCGPVGSGSAGECELRTATTSELANEYTCVACLGATNAKIGTCDSTYICNQDEGVYFDTCVGTSQTKACTKDANCTGIVSEPGHTALDFCDLVTTSPTYQFCVQCDAASPTCSVGSCDLTATDTSYNLCASCSPTNDTTNASCTANDAREPVCDTTAACKQCPTVTGSETQAAADAFCPGHAGMASLHCTSNVCACNVNSDCPGGGSSPASCNTGTGFCNL